VWGLTNEVYAEIGEHDLSARVAENSTQPFGWIDDVVGDDEVTVLAQQVTDATGIWTNEFWNRSIVQVWSVEGSAPGPGPTQTPDLANPDGTLTPAPGTPYVLEVNGVDLQGETVARGGPNGPDLVRIGDTFRLRSNVVGVFSDGWMSGQAAYNRFDVASDGPGNATITLSRETFCPEGARLPGVAEVRVGTIGVGRDKQPAIDRVTGREVVYVPACGSRTLSFPAPDAPWRAEVEIQTFVPKEVDPTKSDGRQLGAVVSFGFVPD
jgi:hypothetical protein